MALKYTVEDYKFTLKSLLPRGRAWNVAADSQFFKLLYGFATELKRVSDRALNLITDLDPNTSEELLVDWERLLGMPDDCSGVIASTVQARRQDVLARITATGGSSIGYLKQVATNQGYNVEFIEHKLALCGRAVCGDPMDGNTDWAFTVEMKLDNSEIILFEAGTSAAGESLGDFDSSRIECLINQIKPAHVYLFTSFQDSFALCGSAECGDDIRRIF